MPLLRRVFLEVLVVVRFGQRRGRRLAGRSLQLLRRQAAILLARAEREVALRVHLECHHHPRLPGSRRRDTFDLPPGLAVQAGCRAPGSAQHVDVEAFVVVLPGGEALRRAGRDLAALREQLGGGPPWLLDGDRLPQRGRARRPLAGGGQAARQQHPSHGLRASARASPRSRSASSIWPLFTIIGGAIRSEFPYRPPLPIRSPRLRAASIRRPVPCGSGSLVPRSFTSSIACIRPMPRTSPMPWKRCWRDSRPSRSALPIIWELKRSFSSSITSSVAAAATMLMGLAPKVEMFANWPLSATASLAIVKPMGWPLAIPFALVRMSGSTPYCCTAHHLPPVRPQAVWTSSAMKRPPWLRAMGTAISKYSLGGVMKPPTPRMGSAMKAAISPSVVVSISDFRSLAQATPQSGYVSPKSQR